MLTVELPTGLTVVLREFKVSDENLLADPKSTRQGASTTPLLNAITHEVPDPGPYELSPPNKKHPDGPWLDWDQVLQGDRMVALLKNRIETWGAEMVFREPCENNPMGCGPVEIEIDLETLPIQTLPEGSKSHVLEPDKHPLRVKLPGCERVVSFRLLRGKDDREIARLQKQKASELSSAYLHFRTVDVEGVPQNEWLDWLKDLGAKDASYLRRAFDEADCGVDQEVVFECGNCGHSWTTDVKFRADFLFPRYRGRTGLRA